MPSVPLGTKVSLSRLERRFVCLLSDLRTANNRRAGVRDAAHIDPETAARQGFGAEWAAALLHGVLPDLSTQPRSVAGGTDAGDFEIEGIRFDVKTSARPDARLLVNANKRNAAIDAYGLLLYEKGGHYTLKGWFPAADLFDPSRRRDYYGRVVQAAEQGELMDFNTLKARLGRPR